MADATPAPSSLPPVWMSIGMALLFVGLSWNLYGVDVNAFLLPWFTHIRSTGPILAFSEPFSNYTPPYLYALALSSPFASLLPSFVVIKFVSLAGHVLLAAAVWRLLVALGHRQSARAAALIACAPTLFVNPAVLTQCDAFWAAALIVALAAAVERRHAAMFVWCGLAVAFKLQAGFIGPFFLALALARRIPLRLWLLAPLAAALALLPAWLAGWPAGDLMTIYLRQARWEDAMALNAPNLWMITQSLPGVRQLPLSAIATCATLSAAASYVLIFSRRLRTDVPATLLRAACLCSLIVPGLLPRMHERYFFLADVLALVIVCIRPAEWRLVAYTQIGSGLAILAYMTGAPLLAKIGAVAMLAATWAAARPFLVATPQETRRAAPVLAT